MNVPSNQRLLVPGPDSASVMWMMSQSLIRISNIFPIFSKVWVTYWFFYHHFLIIFNTPLVILLKLFISNILWRNNRGIKLGKTTPMIHLLIWLFLISAGSSSLRHPTLPNSNVSTSHPHKPKREYPWEWSTI